MQAHTRAHTHTPPFSLFYTEAWPLPGTGPGKEPGRAGEATWGGGLQAMPPSLRGVPELPEATRGESDTSVFPMLGLWAQVQGEQSSC